MHTPRHSFGYVAGVELPFESKRPALAGACRQVRPGALIAALGALLVLPACSSGSSSGSSSENGPAQFEGSWLCNFTLTQPDGVMIYPPSPLETVVTGDTSLSIYDEESDSQPQSWFCGFNYGISGTSATLVGTPTCESNDLVAIQSATISLSADGNEMTLQESGMEYDDGTTEQSTIAGICARN